MKKMGLKILIMMCISFTCIFFGDTSFGVCTGGCKKFVVEDNGSNHTIRCSGCGVVSHGQHTYNRSSASCTESKKCTYSVNGSKCGHVAEAAPGHTGGEATCTTKKKCTRCGARYGKALGHTGGEATCTKGKVCTRCNVEYTNPLGHQPNLTLNLPKLPIVTLEASDYDKDEIEHWKVCERCGVYLYEKEMHYGGQATSTSGPICTICEKEYGNPLSDKFTADGEDANEPKLVAGMIPVKWQGSAWVTTSADDPEWYNYNSSQNIWANVMLNDGMTYYADGKEGEVLEATGTVPNNKVVKDMGSMYVWVPRYTYELSGNDIVDYSWSQGIIDNEKFDKVPAFFYGEYISGDVNDNNSYINRDGSKNELTGIWVAKFLASENNGNIEFKPDKVVSVDKTISEAYVLGKDMMYVNFDKYGIKENAESHMMKNSEWEAVSNLSYLYGTSPYNNSCDKTGYAGSTKDSTSAANVYLYNSVKGRFGSNTHNITGIFDMSGIEEFVSGYLYGGLYENGEELTYIEEGIDVDKYLDEYTYALLGIEGDTVEELTESKAFIVRGGEYKDGSGSGIYGYKATNGGTGYGYRNVIIPINLLAREENVGVLEAKDSVLEGQETVIELLINLSESGELGISSNELLSMLSIGFKQTSDNKIVYTEDLNASIISLNGSTTVNSSTKLNKGVNSLKIKIGGKVNGYPVFKFVENAIGKITIADSFEIMGNIISNINLGTAELDVTKDLSQQEPILIPIKSISIEKYPNKMVVGSDLTGGVIKVERVDGTTEYVSMASEDVEANISGNKVVLTYDKETIEFDLYSTTEKVYLEVNNADGSGTYDKGERVELFYHSEKGNKFLSWKSDSGKVIESEYISYTVPQSNSTITANVANVSKIEVEKDPTKKDYTKGEKVDLRGGRLKVIFTNGSIDYVDMVCKNVYVSPEGSLSESGKVYVLYGAEVTDFDVTVN